MNQRITATNLCVTTGFLLLSGISAAARAQEPGPGTAAAPPPSTVVKNRSPVEMKPLEVAIPAAKEDRLQNGTRVFLIEDHRTPMVTVNVSVRAGSLFETGDKRGVSDLLASALTEGTKSYSADQIAALIDKYGASFNAGAGDERATVSLTCLADDLETLLPVLGEMVYAPAFPEERVDRVRSRAQAGATARKTDPNVLAADALRAALYGAESPYGRPSVTADELGMISVTDLKVFHGKHFRPDNTLIGVAGDVTEKSVLSQLAKVFGSQTVPSAPPAPLPAATLIDKSGDAPLPIVINRPGSAQSVLNFGVPGIQRNNPDYFALLLANRILGGGFNSRLNQKLREEKGYTYGARSSLSAPKWTGIWSASASVRNAVTGDATKDFIAEFAKLQTTPPKEGELNLVKQSLIGSFALTLESPEAVLSRSIERYEYNLPADYWSNYAKNVRAVTPADVTRVARKYLGAAGDPNAASAPRVWAVAVGEKAVIEGDVIKAVAGPSSK